MKSVPAPSETESLTWGDNGSLSSVAETGGSDAGTTSYFYDADGTLIEQDGPSAKTLFLPWEELTVSSSGTSGTRYYSVGGAEIAARTSSGDVSYLLGDQEGTSTLAIDSSTLDPVRRYYDPFGNTVGTAASSWPGLQGFQGGTADPGTGLENIGAREYDPGIAAFTSPDPLLQPTDPQDLNPYAYAQDGSPSLEDPSGQCSSSAGMVCLQGQGGPVIPPEGGGKNGSSIGPDPITGTGGYGASSSSGRSGSGASDGSQGTQSVPVKYLALPLLPVVLRAKYVAFMKTWLGVQTYQGAMQELASLSAFCGTGEDGQPICGRGLATKFFNAWSHLTGQTFGIMQIGGFGQEGEQALNGDAGGGEGHAYFEGQVAQEDLQNLADAATCGGMSFTASTKVLLASGAAIPISQLKPGSKVLATNTKTGKTQAEPVTAVLLHHDTDLYDLTVKTAHGTAVIDTTNAHLFWDTPAKQQWVKAAALSYGSHLRTPDGASVTVVGGHVPAHAVGWMWDLSVPAVVTTTSKSTPPAPPCSSTTARRILGGVPRVGLSRPI